MDVSRVGTGVWIVRDGKVLLGRRIGSHGTNTWCPPGGKVEFLEKAEQCAIRETEEETGLKVKNLTLLAYTDDFRDESEPHYVTLHYVTRDFSGEPSVREPDKFERWDWYSWEALPEEKFLPFENLFKNGFNPTNV